MDESASYNPREFTRSTVHIGVRLTGASGVSFDGTVRDVSLAGVFVCGECSMRPDEACVVELRLDTVDAGIAVQVRGRITRLEPEGVAVEFTEIPLQSLDDLRSLVLYNARDPDKVEEEFASHQGLHRNS